MRGDPFGKLSAQLALRWDSKHIHTSGQPLLLCIYGPILIKTSTSCLQSGKECIYPEQDPESRHSSTSELEIARTTSPAVPSPAAQTSLSDYVGGSYEVLPEASKRLLRHCGSRQPSIDMLSANIS